MMKTCITGQLKCIMASQNEGGRVSGVPFGALIEPKLVRSLIGNSERDAYVLLGISGPQRGGFGIAPLLAV